jgi:serine/threonine protein kinase
VKAVAQKTLRDGLVEATGGRYVIDDELGRGGMAVVYAATDVRLKRAVAIKALPPDLAFRTDVRTRFLREAQMAAALSHPHIVPIYSVEETEGLVFMVMGLVRGESLAQKLHRDGRMGFTETRRILREAADALVHAHAHGVIHRDIKPDNILIDGTSGRVVVTDFGIARALEGDARITVTGVAVGTPTYMSPEQARGDHDVDGRADVYALGVVGFQMLAGEPPFNAPNTPALLLKHVSEPPPPVSTRRPDAPRALAHAIDRALAKDRAERWGSARAMYDALAEGASAPSASLARPRQAVAENHRPNGSPASAKGSAYPIWRGGSPEEKERWQKARRAWEADVKTDRQSKDETRSDARARREAERESRRAQSAEKRESITERVRKFQKHVISNGMIMLMLFVINAATGGFPWFIFPWIGMTIGIVGHAFSLWQDGILLRDVFRRPSHLAQREAPPLLEHASAEARSFDSANRARALVGNAVYSGVHGGAVRRAVEDERAVQEILKSLSPADRAQLPDLEPTLRSLVDRVVSIAQALHALDTDVNPDHIARLDARVAEAKSLPTGASDRERRITLLERQRTSLAELVKRRGALADELENAALLLQTMRLDLLRLRSAGIGNAASELSSVTQEARAVSRDIGRVLDAAAEVRKL